MEVEKDRKINTVGFCGEHKADEMLRAYNMMKCLSPRERGVIVTCIRRNSLRPLIEYVERFKHLMRKELKK